MYPHDVCPISVKQLLLLAKIDFMLCGCQLKII